MKKVVLFVMPFSCSVLLAFHISGAGWVCVFIYWALRSSPFGVVYNTRASAHKEEGGRSV